MIGISMGPLVPGATNGPNSAESALCATDSDAGSVGGAGAARMMGTLPDTDLTGTGCDATTVTAGGCVCAAIRSRESTVMDTVAADTTGVPATGVLCGVCRCTDSAAGRRGLTCCPGVSAQRPRPGQPFRWWSGGCPRVPGLRCCRNRRVPHLNWRGRHRRRDLPGALRCCPNWCVPHLNWRGRRRRRDLPWTATVR